MASAYPERELSLVFDIPETSGNDGTAPFTLGILSSDKIKGIGWHPKHALKDGIRRTVSYLESEGMK